MRKVWRREDILKAANIKPIEWPVGWYLNGPPDYSVTAKPIVQNRRK